MGVDPGQNDALINQVLLAGTANLQILPNTTPTRYPRGEQLGAPHVLDYIAVSRELLPCVRYDEATVIPPDTLSDHCSIMCTLDLACLASSTNSSQLTAALAAPAAASSPYRRYNKSIRWWRLRDLTARQQLEQAISSQDASVLTAAADAADATAALPPDLRSPVVCNTAADVLHAAFMSFLKAACSPSLGLAQRRVDRSEHAKHPSYLDRTSRLMVFRIRFLLALRAELMRSQQLGHRRAAYMRTELLLASAELQKEFLVGGCGGSREHCVGAALQLQGQ